MDVRQFAFLARQPSAALKNREHFLGLPKRGLAFILANAMFWQPLLAQADGIVVNAPGTTLGQAGNGVPIVNIAAPNAQGLSHNQFSDYNVGANGVILNNATARTQSTQLGGIIVGNPNFTGAAANVILNEVNGGSPSQLRGYTEVAGQSAHVIVANPYGISCNGCGFINTPQATLTTGKAVITNGQVTGYQVDQGSVSIDGAGLNANNVDQFEIITRAASINAQINAKQLTIIAGRNDVDARTLSSTARADDGSSKPQVAIDSSALGGMYAGTIKLVGTEAGVGVKLAGNLAASGGDIQLDANGQLSLVQATASGAVNVKAVSLDAQGPVYAGSSLNVQTTGDLTSRNNLAARDSITLNSGGQLTNLAIIEAGVNADNTRNSTGDVSVTAQNISNSGQSVIASRDLSVSATQALGNQGGTLSGQRQVSVAASTLDNQNKGRVLSGGTLGVSAGQLLNTQGGLIHSNGSLTANLGALSNGQAEISSLADVNLTLASLDNVAGLIAAGSTLNINASGAFNNQGGRLAAQQNLQVNAAWLDNSQQGSIVSQGNLGLTTRGVLDNHQSGQIQSNGAAVINSASLDNHQSGLLSSNNALNLTSGQVNNSESGRITSAMALTVNATGLDQHTQGQLSGTTGLTLDLNQGLLNNQNALITTPGALLLKNLSTVVNQNGEISSHQGFTLAANSLDNSAGGKVLSDAALALLVNQTLNNAQGVLSGNSLAIQTASLLNTGGRATAQSALNLTLGSLDNSAGSTLDNSGGNFSGLKGLDIRLDGALLNHTGLLSSEGALTVNAASLDNSAGQLGSGGALSITSLGAVLNQGGSILTDQGLTLASASLDNRQQGVINGTGATRVTTGTLDNSQGGHLTSDDSLDLSATQVTNQGGRIASEKTLTASVTGLDQQGGELFSKTRLNLDLHNGQLNNQHGVINGPLLVLNNLNGVANQNGEISSAQAYTLAAQSLDNSNGKLLSEQGLTLRITQALGNLNGLISAASLDSRSASLDNGQGLISSRGAVDLGVTNAFTNQNGTLIGDGALLLTANSLDNSNGAVSGKLDVTANIASLNNQNGQLIAGGALTLNGSALDNRQGGLVGATKALKLTVDQIDNRAGEISGSADLSLTGTRLDNSNGGKVLANTALGLKVAQVINQSLGQLRSQGSASLSGASLDNSGGALSAQSGLVITLDNALTNRLKGLISSEGNLTLNVASLDNSAGSLSSAGALNLTSAGALINQGGRLVTDNPLTLNSTSLDNTQQGVISAKGAVSVSTGAFDNSNGSLSSADSLSLTAGQVTNQGGSLGSEKALTASVSGLDQQGGKLFSHTALSLDLNHGQLNNQNGLINAPSLVLNNLKGVNNQGGELSSAQAFNLLADSLDNSNGKLLSNQALTVRVNQALSNLKGQIAAAALDVRAASLDNSGGTLTSRSDLSLTTTGLLTNQSLGLINAAQTLNITSADLNNQGGTLLGTGAVTLNAMALNNTANGLINSQGGLTITANSLDSSNGGEVSAKGDIGLNLGALTQNGGRLLGSQALSLDLAGGDLDNRNGLLNAQGPLSLNRLRDLNNQNGELSSSQSFNMAGRTLDNSGGKLISSNQLGVSGTSVVNQGGLISGWQGLAVNGGSLDNRNSGTVSSRSGNLGVTLSGALLNSGNGALVSQNSLTVNAASLDNSGGILSSGAAQQLTVSGLLNNAAGGSIDSGAALTLNAMALTNSGTVSAQQALSFTGITLDNSSGSLTGNGAVNLDLLGVLTNTNGKLASGGPLVISRSSQINNQGGQLVSQGLLSVLSGGLDNSNRGTVAANGALTLTTGGGVQNSADGLIYSQNGDVTLSAASLANGKGTVQGQGALNLTVAGDIDNQSGKLIAQNGDLNVSAANLDNRGGTLASVKAALEARIVGVLKNGYDLNNNRQGGITQAQRLTLSALGGIDNYGGRISAQSGDAVITSADFDNRNGGLYAKGLVQVSGNNFDNSGDNDGQIAGQRIDLSLNGALNNRLGIIESDSTLSVRAASLDNQTGQLRALGTSGKTDLQIGGMFDNRNGKLETANTDLTLNAAGFQNLGGSLLHVGTGTFDIATANILNAGGSLVTRGGLTLTADSWTNSSVIQAGRLTLNVNTLNQTAGGQLLASTSLVGNGVNWNNDGLIASDGTASLNLAGNYGGNGRYSSLGTLGLSAASLNLGSTGSIAGGDTTTINVGGELNNYGRITSAAGMSVSAGSINNYGTLGSNGNLLLSTPTLLNENGLIFSGGDTALQVNSFTNHSAQLYSLGAVSIGGYGGAAQAAQVSNISGSLESTGQFNINAANFENRTESFSLGRKLVSGFIAVKCIRCWGSYFGASIVASETFEGQDNDTSAASSLSAGGDFAFRGGSFLNSKSTISAGGNIAIQADNVKNIGAVSGTIERTRSYWTGDIDKWLIIDFANAAFNYNARNNPDFPNIYYINDSGGLSRALAVDSTRRTGGHDGDWEPVIRFRDAVTGSMVNTFDLPPIYNNLSTKPQSQYDPNNLVALPSQLQSYPLTGDVEVAKDGSASGRSAVIQAAGNVSISATQDLTNSVIHQDYGFSAGANKVQGTQVAGTGAPAVVRINAQLPPNLAQQQVNPLTLPGFSLPTGQNGLFRLSGQGGSVRQASQANLGSQNWSMGGAAVSTAQRQQGQPEVQARHFQIDDLSPVAASDRQLTQTTRQATGSSVGASVINVAAPVDTGSNVTQLPGYISSASAITQPGTVQVDAAHQPVAVVVPGVTPTLPVTQRDPLIPAIAPGISTLARVQGLPDMSARSNPQKYLVETNPVLTDLKQFMSSDYLLSGLGYNPDTSAKRLGDGFYEQKLIQQAVVARTGQRFIDGQTSNEKLFKYLMDNAISSKQQLNLSVGVSLTSEQVAALTHDIVWMEKQVVNGEEVLVPVLYLANANNRLAPNGALIQGSDVTLIAGANLENSGTLRASNNLKATAGNDLVNTGLIEAGNRLDLLAGNNIVNKSGGIIAGRDVSVTAVNGDVLNQRDVNHTDQATGFTSTHRELLDSAARIEAANNLTAKAGRDVSNNGSVMQSDGDMVIQAGRDIDIAATESHDTTDSGEGAHSSSITQTGSTVSAGRDLQMTAGRDLTAIASQIDAKRDIAMAATENLTLGSAADESHFLSKSRRETTQKDHVAQVATTVQAGGDVKLSAGKDLGLIASKVSAGNEAYLVAGDQLDLLSAQNSDYSLYDMKKRGSWGRKKTQHDEVTQVTNVGSEIKTGGNLTLQSGSDQHYQVAKLESGKDLTIESGGGITFEGQKDLHQESHEKTNNNAFWVASKGSGKTDETLRQTQMAAAGNITIKAVEGLKIDLKQVDQQSVSQTIDAMVKADPKMAWLKDAEKRGDVDWHLVKEIHDSYQYSNSGLGPASQLIIAIALAAVMGPMMAGLSTITQAGALTVATKATVSTIDNRGNLGAVLKDVTSKDSLKSYAVSMATAGVAQGLNYNPGSVGFNLQSAQTVALKVAADSVIKTAVYGGSFKDNLASSAAGTAASIGGAIGAGKIGDLKLDNGGLEKTLLHAGLGGLLSKAMGGDFRTGAIAGGANELLVGALGDKLLPENLVPGSAEYIRAEANLKALTQIVGVLGAAASGGDVGIASAVAENATQYNYLNHHQVDNLVEELKGCRGTEDPAACRGGVKARYQITSDKTTNSALNGCPGEAGCLTQLEEIKTATESLGKYVSNKELTPEESDIVQDFQESNTHDQTIAHTIWLTNFQKEVTPIVLSGGGGAAVEAAVSGEGRAVAAEVAADTGGTKDVVPNPGKTAVYSSTAEDGTVQYVGITDNLEARSAAHLSQKGIEIDAIPGLQNISRSDARAVEQVLIEYNGLGKDGGSLINKINSISTANPIYAESLARGAALLKTVGYPGFK